MIMLGNTIGISSSKVGPSGGPFWEVPGFSTIAIWDAKNAASLADSYIDLSGNGNDLSPTPNPPESWDTTEGWLFDSTVLQQGLDTGLTLDPYTDTIIIWYKRNGAAGGPNPGYLFGSYTGTNQYYMARKFNNYINSYNGNSATIGSSGGWATTGTYCMTGPNVYIQNNAYYHTYVHSPKGYISSPIHLGRTNTSNGSWWGWIRFAAMYYGTMSESEVADLAARVDAAVGV